MGKMKWFDWLAIVLLLVGGLNWGLVAVFNFDFVMWLLPQIYRIIEGLVGVASVFAIVRFAKIFG